MLFTYEEFKNHYNIRLNFIEKKTSFQNGLTFSAIFSRPSLLKYNILLPPHFCIEPNKSAFHGE
jgi:hypothetical protein